MIFFVPLHSSLYFLLLFFNFLVSTMIAGRNLRVLRVVPDGQIRRLQRRAPQNQEGH